MNNNFFRFDISTQLFSFNFLHQDNLSDLTQSEREEYFSQKQLWEMQDSLDPGVKEDLDRLYADARQFSQLVGLGCQLISPEMSDEDTKVGWYHQGNFLGETTFDALNKFLELQVNALRSGKNSD